MYEREAKEEEKEGKNEAEKAEEEARRKKKTRKTRFSNEDEVEKEDIEMEEKGCGGTRGKRTQGEVPSQTEDEQEAARKKAKILKVSK